MKFINEKTINIFTDASVKQMQNGTYISVPGYIISVIDLNYKTNGCDILFNSTNNEGEITAILLGLTKLLEIKRELNLNLNDYTINVFSDSLICVKSLREWIFKWSNKMHNGIMYNSNNTPVLNQDIIKYIIDLIVTNNINVNFYHIKGHSENMSLDKIRDIFHQNNNILIDFESINIIRNENILIDKITRSIFTLYSDIELRDRQTYCINNIMKNIIIPIISKEYINCFYKNIINC